MATINTMKTKADAIAQETAKGKNTATRIGTLFQEIVSFFTNYREKTDSLSKTETAAAISAAISEAETTLNQKLAAKADKATTLAGYGILDALTGAQTTLNIDTAKEELTDALKQPSVDLLKLNDMGTDSSARMPQIMANQSHTHTRFAITYNNAVVGTLDCYCEYRQQESLYIIHQRAVSCYDIPTVDTLLKTPGYTPTLYTRTYYSKNDTSHGISQGWTAWKAIAQ